MNGLRETCHCSHDKATHFADASDSPVVHRTCLAAGCECRLYVNEFLPKPAAAPRARPWHISTCQCARCKEYAAATGTTIPEKAARSSTWPPYTP